VAFEEIPIIDFAPMLGSDLAAKRALATELRHACTEIGFFYIKNHGVPQDLIDAAFAECPRFFGLPLAEKMAIHVRNSTNNSGYTPLLEENTDPTAKGDLHEAFDIAHELPETEPDRALVARYYGANQWPAEAAVPGFRHVIETYYRAMHSLGRRLFSAFALALDLPEDYFAPLTNRPTAVMRILAYPSQGGVIDPQQIGIGAHSDYECFTILAQETVPALQDPRHLRHQYRRPDGALDERHLRLHAASGGQHLRPRALLDPVLPRLEPRHADRGTARLRQHRSPGEISSRSGRRLRPKPVRRDLRLPAGSRSAMMASPSLTTF
jgi:hypothetical protein